MSSTIAPMDRAAAVISIDTEMAWGLNHRRGAEYRYDDERVHTERLLELFGRHQVPATWAVVGHLMLDRCRVGPGGVKHPEIVRPDYDWYEGDWFDDDPCTDAGSAPTWYAPDVVAMIRAAATGQTGQTGQSGQTGHEIASHGFSHIVAGDPGCSRETFESEVEAAVAAATSAGMTLRSFVHPRNRIGHVDVLVEHGIVAYRGKRRRAEPLPASPSERAWERVRDRTLGSERTAIRPVREESGIWNLPATIMFDVDARPRMWRLWLRQVERRLDQAVARRSLFHLWFHPHNLRDHPEQSFEALDRICTALARHRDQGELDTLTMGSLADRLTAAFPAV